MYVSLIVESLFPRGKFYNVPRKGKTLDSPDLLWKTVPYLDPLDRECFGHSSHASSQKSIVVAVYGSKLGLDLARA